MAVFLSVSQALHVAFLIGSLPMGTKGPMQVAIEVLQREAGMLRERVHESSVDFRGLSPLEVRGQCTMVRAAVVDHCTAMERHALHAWYALDASKAEGVRQLKDFFDCRFTIDSHPARMLVVWHVHAQGRARDVCTERAIAAEHGLSQSTIHRNIVQISKGSTLLRMAGTDRLQEFFERSGLVEAPESAVSS